MTEALKPPHAISIWVADNILYAELPNLHGGTAHYLKLPNNVWGMTQLVNIVTARRADSRIGSKGDQTQAQAEKEMKALAKGIDPSAIRKSHMKVSAEQRSTIADMVRRMFR